MKTQQVRLQYIQNGLTVTPEVVEKKMEAAAPSNVSLVHYESTQQFLADVASKGTGFDWIKERIRSVVAAHDSGGQNVTKTSAQGNSLAR